MTTIIYEKDTIYGDSRITKNDVIESEDFQKVFKVISENNNMYILGFSGLVIDYELFCRNIENIINGVMTIENCNCIIRDLTRKKTFVIDSSGSVLDFTKFDFLSVGSGWTFAKAMKLINNTMCPKNMIENISKLDPFTNNKVKIRNMNSEPDFNFRTEKTENILIEEKSSFFKRLFKW